MHERIGAVLLMAAAIGCGQPAGTQPTQPPATPPTEPAGIPPTQAPGTGTRSSTAAPPSGGTQTQTPPPASEPSAPSTGGAQYATARGTTVIWKRYAAIEADLMRALDLKRDEVCNELGARSCTRDIHTIALGGNDPFRSGINRPAPETSGTTPIAVDRVLLNACSARAQADSEGPPKVFTALDLRGPAPSPQAPGVDATISDLYARLLSRDATIEEVAAIKSLLDAAAPDAPQSAREFAILACYVIGSSLEFLFA